MASLEKTERFGGEISVCDLVETIVDERTRRLGKLSRIKIEFRSGVSGSKIIAKLGAVVQRQLFELGCGGSQIRTLDPELGVPASLRETRGELDQIVVARAECRDRLAVLPDHGDAHGLETGVGEFVKPAIRDVGPQDRDGTKPVRMPA